MPDQPNVRPERTSWRDAQISQRHRLYGWDAPALDIDFLMVEFDTGKPAALVEYKVYGARAVDLAHPSFKAIRALADAASIPFFVAYYGAHDHWWYYVIPMNGLAVKLVPQRRYFSERNYVELLYRVRGKTAPATVIAQLNTFQPVPRKP